MARVTRRAAPTAYESNGYTGQVFDASVYLKDRLGLGKRDTLRVYHHAREAWGTPGVRTRISPYKSGGLYGKGFYSSTKPETLYGKFEFDLEIPVSAFEGKKVVEVPRAVGDGFTMPAGVDIMTVRHGTTVWFIFKPGSETWLNRVSTESDFDRPDELIGP